MKLLIIVISFQLLLGSMAQASMEYGATEPCAKEAPGIAKAPDWMDEFLLAMMRMEGETPGYDPGGDHLAAVFGAETRVIIDKAVSPWTTIGRISNGVGICTGTLISECVAVTAAHCVHFNANGEFTELDFTPRFATEAPYSAKTVLAPKGWMKPDAEREKWTNEQQNYNKDWALVHLRGRPGKKHGYLGIRANWSQSTAKNVKRFYIAGHSVDFADRQLSVDMDARSITLEPPTPGAAPIFYYEADSASGSSGGPILEERDNKFRLIGVNVRAHLDKKNASTPLPVAHGDPTMRAVGVTSDEFFDDFTKMLKLGCDD